MLTPEQLANLPNNLVRLYVQTEADIIADLAARISAMNLFIPSAGWQFAKLIEMGNSYDMILSKLQATMTLSKAELQQLMVAAGSEALKYDDSIHRAAGKIVPTLNQSAALLAVLNAGIAKTNGAFENLCKTTANMGSRQFADALDRAYMQVTSGAFSHQEAIKTAVKDLSSQGLNAVTYKNGRTMGLEAAVRMNIVTGVNQTGALLQLQRSNEMGCNLVEVTAHAGARPSHTVWQGRIFSLNGETSQYSDFYDATGYGTATGLCGANCRHSFFPFYEGLPRAYPDQDIAELNGASVTYKGNEISQYDASQVQRKIERNMRRWKREKQAMQAAGLPTDEAAAKLKYWRGEMNDFIGQTGLKRQYSREEIFGKTIAAKDDIIKGTVSNTRVALDRILEQNWFKQLKPEDCAELRDIFGQMTEKELSFWDRYGNLVKGDFYDRKAGGYYSPVEKAVHLQIDRVDARAKRIGHKNDNRVFFHENGHLFDNQVFAADDLIQHLPELRSKLETDYISFANKIFEKNGVSKIKSLKKLTYDQKQLLSADLFDDVNLKNAISDLVGGLTPKRVQGGYGHEKIYWARANALEKEAFAHLFEAKMLKGERLSVFKEYFPDTYQYFEEYLDKL